MANTPAKIDEQDFSLALGGPLYQLYIRTRLARPPLEWLVRRLAVFMTVTWVPPLVLSLAAGTALGGVDVPFSHDIVMHARFLLALPLFLIAELFVHMRMAPIVNQFLVRRLIAPADESKYRAAMAAAMRWRNSIAVEVFLLVLCFTGGHLIWAKAAALESAWYSLPAAGGTQLTPAGIWYGWISMPVFQFIYLRWLFRLVIWMRFLWQVSRLPLQLVPTHPDRAGGLGFLEDAASPFVPVILAQSAVLAGLVAERIFFQSAALASFKVEIVTQVVLQMLLILGPLCVFVPQMASARRRGWREYGTLAMQYVQAFDSKWVKKPAAREDLLGSGDIQSLADMGNSYQVAAGMAIVPFGRRAIAQVVIATVVPIAPLILTVIPIEQIIARLVGIAF